MATADYSFHVVEIQKLMKVIGEKCLRVEVSKDANEFAEINNLLGKVEGHCEALSMWALDGFRKDVR